MAKRSEPRSYPYPPQTVFAGIMTALPQTKLKIVGADPNQGIIRADKGVGLASWGEKVTIYVQPAAQGQTTVTVDSALKFGFVAWGAHERNFRTVFEAADRGIPYAAQQPPGPA